jgi:hypothetical protein
VQPDAGDARAAAADMEESRACGNFGIDATGSDTSGVDCDCWVVHHCGGFHVVSAIHAVSTEAVDVDGEDGDYLRDPLFDAVYIFSGRMGRAQS